MGPFCNGAILQSGSFCKIWKVPNEAILKEKVGAFLHGAILQGVGSFLTGATLQRVFLLIFTTLATGFYPLSPVMRSQFCDDNTALLLQYTGWWSH